MRKRRGAGRRRNFSGKTKNLGRRGTYSVEEEKNQQRKLVDLSKERREKAL